MDIYGMSHSSSGDKFSVIQFRKAWFVVAFQINMENKAVYSVKRKPG